MSTSSRHAYTLLELLVVIAIITLLVGLLLPAVQKVRDAAARLQCMNNLKQIGLAAHQYHDARKIFPAGMSFENNRAPLLYATWLTQLLPYIEQQPLWRVSLAAYRQSSRPFVNPPHVGLSTVIPLFVCPSDGRAEQVQVAQREQIPVAFTCYLGVEGKDTSSLDGILFRDSKVRVADITDGTSSTLFAGERPPSADFQYGWWYAGVGQSLTGSLDSVLGVQEKNLLPVTRGSCPPGVYSFGPGSVSNQCDMFHFWSLHSGGGNFLFADGSIRFLTYSVEPLMPALASRNGSEVVPGF
jgi:prepilin-type processing-associated H-X9-DG protein/prepilin-type N-terminal cleavage/methylation domain-containing protein